MEEELPSEITRWHAKRRMKRRRSDVRAPRKRSPTVRLGSSTSFDIQVQVPNTCPFVPQLEAIGPFLVFNALL